VNPGAGSSSLMEGSLLEQTLYSNSLKLFLICLQDPFYFASFMRAAFEVVLPMPSELDLQPVESMTVSL
jgi:hypothetical protein